MTAQRWPEAAGALNAALASHERLIERDPTNREERRDIAGLYSLMSELNRKRGDVVNADKYAAMAERVRLK